MSDTITTEKGKIRVLYGYRDEYHLCTAILKGADSWLLWQFPLSGPRKMVVGLGELTALFRSWGATRIEAEARFDLPLGETNGTEVGNVG